MTLLRINGETPTEKQQQKLIKDKLKRTEEKAPKKENQIKDKPN